MALYAAQLQYDCGNGVDRRLPKCEAGHSLEVHLEIEEW